MSIKNDVEREEGESVCLYQSFWCCHRSALSANANFLSFYKLCFWYVPYLPESKEQHSQLWKPTWFLIPLIQWTLILTFNFGTNSVHLCFLLFQSWSRFSSPAVSPNCSRQLHLAEVLEEIFSLSPSQFTKEHPCLLLIWRMRACSLQSLR